VLYKVTADLRAIVSPALLATGCVNVVGLDGLKNCVGSQWPQLRDSVYTRLEALFRAKLGPTDFFVRLDDSAYLLAMPSSDPEDVDVVSLRISYDLYISCLGQCDLDHIQVSSASVGDGDTLALELLPFERIIALAEKAGIQSFNVPAGPGDLRLPENERGCNPAAAATAVPLPADKGRTLYVEHHFIPVWSAAGSAVTTYICEAKSILDGERRQPIQHVQLSPKERVNTEITCLHAGIAKIARNAQPTERFLLGITISFDLLGSPSGRMEFLSACRELSSDYRQYIDFTLTEVPPGVAQTTLSNMVNMLRPFARSVSATVAPQARVYAAYQGIGLRAIGFDLREFSNGRTFRQLDADQLVRNARVANLGTFLLSVTGASALEIAHAAAIQQLSGNAVLPPCDTPRGMWRLAWSDLMERQLAS
jgi:hypothetical protein